MVLNIIKMACNLLSRLFRRRAKKPTASLPHPSSSALLPAHSDKVPLECSVQQHSSNPGRDEFSFLGYLCQQGSYTLIIHNVPSTTETSHLRALRNLPGFVGFEITDAESSIATNILVHFSTAAEAASAMASQPVVAFDGGITRRLRFDEKSQDPCQKRAKRKKTPPSILPPQCLACDEEIQGRQVKACFYCDSRWCCDCLRTNILTALNYPELFPPKCCDKILHFDVAKDILPAADYDKYKARFEEFCTTKPVYCANLECATFLPPRVSRPTNRGHVYCPSCHNTTCSKCKELVEIAAEFNHICTTADEMVAMMKQYGYKRCPRCDMGVAKMHGCSHVRCQCGAHWCWDCLRPVVICWSKPCLSVRELTNDDDVDNSGVIDSTAVAQVNTVEVAPQEPVGYLQQSLTAAQSHPPTSPETSSIINLDAESWTDWTGSDYDFGDEPISETWDAWGCQHLFTPVHKAAIHQHWLPVSSDPRSSKELKQIHCLKCYRAIGLGEAVVENKNPSEQANGSGNASTTTKQSPVPTSGPENAPIVAQSMKTAKKKRKGRRETTFLNLFNCKICGVFYCLECKKLATKELNAILDANMVES